jgi:GNAT superfamily N-acetyltransferase
VTAKFTLRAVTEADLPALRRLVRGLAVYEKLEAVFTATEVDFHNHLFGPGAIARAALASVGGHDVGVALWYYTFNTFAGRKRLFVEDVFVEPEHRRQGIGLGLFRHMARVAQAEDCAMMEWTVLDWNQPSIDFYHRLGARPAKEWIIQRLHGDALTALAAEGPTHG